MDWLTEIQDRLDTLDPGGWAVLKPIKGEPHFLPEIWHAIDNTLIGRMVNAQDAEFVAHAPTDIAKLIMAVRQSQMLFGEIQGIYDSSLGRDIHKTAWKMRQIAVQGEIQLQSGEIDVTTEQKSPESNWSMLLEKLYRVTHDKMVCEEKFDECGENDDGYGQSVILPYIMHYDKQVNEVMEQLNKLRSCQSPKESRGWYSESFERTLRRLNEESKRQNGEFPEEIK